MLKNSCLRGKKYTQILNHLYIGCLSVIQRFHAFLDQKNPGFLRLQFPAEIGLQQIYA